MLAVEVGVNTGTNGQDEWKYLAVNNVTRIKVFSPDGQFTLKSIWLGDKVQVLVGKDEYAELTPYDADGRVQIELGRKVGN